MTFLLRGWVWRQLGHKGRLKKAEELCRVVCLHPSLMCGPTNTQTQTPTTQTAAFLHLSTPVTKKRRGRDEKHAVHMNPKPQEKNKKAVVGIWKNMTVQELANAMGRDLEMVFEMFLYVDNSDAYHHPNASIGNLRVIQDTVKRGGLRFRIQNPPNDTIQSVDKNDETKDAFKRPLPRECELTRRPAVVTIMGHVDHGKTTLLDTLRSAAVVDTEFGGITQHIGAFSVALESGERVTFLDTPGHAAFGAMRARGAMITDIVVLVVAADDGVMEQTKESITYANEARVPIVVAINKIDKPEADLERTRRTLLNTGLQLEEDGGEIQSVGISALHGTNLSQLVEAIVTQAEVLNVRADPHGLVEASVVESKVDSGRGKVATCVVERGTLTRGAVLVAGTAWGKVRNMFDDGGRPVQSAPPAMPVQIIGWRDLPSAGDQVLEVESEQRAKEVVAWRQHQENQVKLVEAEATIKEKLEEHLKVYKAQLLEKRRLGIRRKMRSKAPRQKQFSDECSSPRVSLVLKGDVDGSVEAILNVLDTYHGSECDLDLLSYGVGAVTPSDVTMAEAFKGSIYTFNTSVPKDVHQLAKVKGVPIREHNVIYHLVDRLKQEISDNLPLLDVEEIIGEANVIEEFLITEGKKKIPVAGCRCTKGVLKRHTHYKLVRELDIIHQGKLSSMRHVKAEVNSIPRGGECGLKLEDEEVRFQPGDTLICYQINNVKQLTEWDPGF
ncbi:hypothetical protein Pmani_021406 [Petrolisthes manimaculis]|uniref:Tr-type G domain-containing protein n=1 Tax=Petrolisthes manimaculis TaxID=1843537 RepID=A0AAE1U1Q5_9EUCA|nr:hypothetical protein Pmani_021406 [Petrolisthes manimaculis]